MSELHASLLRRLLLVLASAFLVLVVCNLPQDPPPSGCDNCIPLILVDPPDPAACAQDQYPPESVPPLIDHDITPYHYFMTPVCQEESATVEAGGSSGSTQDPCTGAELAVQDQGANGNQAVRFQSTQSNLKVEVTCIYDLEQDLPQGVAPALCTGRTTWQMDYDMMTTGGMPPGDPRELWFRARLLTAQSRGVETRPDVAVRATAACSDGASYTCTKDLSQDGEFLNGDSYGPFYLCNFEGCTGDCTVTLEMDGFARNQGQTTHILVLDLLPERETCRFDSDCQRDDAPPGHICGPGGFCQDGVYSDPCEDPTDCDAGAGYYCLEDGSGGVVGRGLCYDGRIGDPCAFDDDCQTGVCADQGGDYGACAAVIP